MKKKKLVKLVKRLEEELCEVRDAHLRISQKHREAIIHSAERIEALRGKIKENDAQHNVYQMDLSNLNKIIKSMFENPEVINVNQDGKMIGYINFTPTGKTPLATALGAQPAGDKFKSSAATVYNITDSITFKEIKEVWDSIRETENDEDQKRLFDWVFSLDKNWETDLGKYVTHSYKFDPEKDKWTYTFNFNPAIGKDYMDFIIRNTIGEKDDKNG